mmetsp:Transcript_11770/g.27051  ORF Transcript_11770/g.27051 Transcript_11770/m.27051 type:complete len:218 (-) Transcript_11770:800-1453(-)
MDSHSTHRHGDRHHRQGRAGLDPGASGPEERSGRDVCEAGLYHAPGLRLLRGVEQLLRPGGRAAHHHPRARDGSRRHRRDQGVHERHAREALLEAAHHPRQDRRDDPRCLQRPCERVGGPADPHRRWDCVRDDKRRQGAEPVLRVLSCHLGSVPQRQRSARLHQRRGWRRHGCRVRCSHRRGVVRAGGDVECMASAAHLEHVHGCARRDCLLGVHQG